MNSMEFVTGTVVSEALAKTKHGGVRSSTAEAAAGAPVFAGVPQPPSAA